MTAQPEHFGGFKDDQLVRERGGATPMNPNSASTMVSVRPAVPADLPTILDFITQLAVFEKCPEKVFATEETLRKTLGLESEQSSSETKISSTTLRAGQFAKCVIAQVDNEDAGFAVFFYNYSTVRTLSHLP